MKEQSLNQLASVRNLKKSQVTDYFSDLKNQLQQLLGAIKKEEMSTYNTRAVAELEEFDMAMSTLSGNRQDAESLLATLFVTGSETQPQNTKVNRIIYDELHNDIHPKYKGLVEKFSLLDLFLIFKTGTVTYSVKKNPQFGTNLNTGEYTLSGLANTFRKVVAASKKIKADDPFPFIFTDFSFDEITQQQTAYIATPLFNFGEFDGAIVFQISQAELNKIMTERDGLGETGEAYLIGPDHHLRSQPYRLDQLNNENNSPTDKFDSLSIQQALNGIAVIGESISYLGDQVLEATSPISVYGQKWAVVVQLTKAEANSSIRQLSLIVTMIILATIVAILIIGYFLTNTIASPVATLTQNAEAIASGDLEKGIDIQRKDELGRLASSFNTMRDAIKTKIDEIEQKNKALLKLDEMKNDLLANTSHELRTPLNGIIGLTESLLHHVPEEKQRTLYHIIASGRRLNSLVNDILDAAKLKHKEIQLQPISLNLRQIVDLDFSMSAHLIGKKPLELINKVDADLCVKADQNRLQQIFQNLIGNAIKFTETGSVIVQASRQGDWVEISIKDTGIGIDEKELQRIFKPFEQADGSSTRQAGGTGLGLSITKQLVELHGGTLNVDSVLDNGSTFVFSLPASDTQPENQYAIVPKTVGTIDDENAVGTLNASKDFEILVVDDEPVNLQIVLNHLANSKCKVTTRVSGVEALEYVAQQKPDLILLDVMMPELDGFETCIKIRQQYSSYQLPIVFLTARNQIQDLVEAFKVGGNDYLSKPFYKDELLSRVQIQIELVIQRQRMAKLRQFANNLSQYKSHEDMATAAYELLVPDPLIEQAAVFFEGEKLHSNHEDLIQLPNSMEGFDEYESEGEGQITMYNALSNLYVLAAKFPKSSSEEWIRNLTLQIQKSMEQIRRVSSNPDISLVQTEIKPKLDRILYIKVEKNYCLVFVEEEERIKEEIHRIPFKQLLMYLEKEHMIQIHRSIAVNPQKVTAFNQLKQSIVLEGDTSVPIAKKYLKDLKSAVPSAFRN